MKACFLFLVLFLGACASVPTEPTVDMGPYIPRIRESLEFSSDAAKTRRFFAGFVEETGDADERMKRFYDVLGENVSSAVLSMKDPYADQISLNLNREMDVFVKEVNRRVFSGGSLVEMQDVVGVSLEGDFLKVSLESPGILSGFVYIMKDPIEGRSPSEQTFVDFYRSGQETRKLSISALIDLLDE